MTDKTAQGGAKKMWDDLDFASEEAVNAEEATFDMISRAEADALVAAAYKVVAKAMGDYHWNRYRTKDEGGVLSYPAVFSSHTWQEAQEACLSLTQEDADAALETMLAEAEKRGEKRGMLRAAEIAEAETGYEYDAGGNAIGTKPPTGKEVAAAIRAEAEE